MSSLNSQKQVIIQLLTPCCQECSEYRNISWKHCYQTSCTFNSCFESFQSLHHQKKPISCFILQNLPAYRPSTKLLEHTHNIPNLLVFTIKNMLIPRKPSLPPTLNISEVKALWKRAVGIDMHIESNKRAQGEIKAKPRHSIYTRDSWVLRGQPQLVPL